MEVSNTMENIIPIIQSQLTDLYTLNYTLTVLLLSTSVTSAYLLSANSGWQNLRSASSQALMDCGRAAGFRCQWTNHLEHLQTAGTRAVTGRLHTCTEDAPALDHPALLRCFYVIPTPKTNALTDLLTYCKYFLNRSNLHREVVTQLKQTWYLFRSLLLEILKLMEFIHVLMSFNKMLHKQHKCTNQDRYLDLKSSSC